MHVVERLFHLRTRHQSAIPRTLYHYTDARGALGILQDRSLWYTHFEYLNDKLEGRYFFEMLRRWNESRPAGRAERFWVEPLLEKGLDLLRPFGTPYVLSLTEDPDSLSQWRSYGGDGAGYAIGFLGVSIAALTRPEVRPNTIGRVDALKVIYDEGAQLELLDEFARAAPNPRDWADRIAVSALAALLFAPLFKHPAFSHEREWRVVISGQGLELAQIQPDPSVELARWVDGMKGILKFRASATFGIVPYLAIGEAVLPLLDGLTEVRCGPRLAGVEAERAVSLLLASTHAPTTPLSITQSIIPYR